MLCFIKSTCQCILIVDTTSSFRINLIFILHFDFSNSTFFHLVAIVLSSVSLVNSSSWRSIRIVLLLVGKYWLHHHLILLLLFLVFEVSPFCQNLHCLNIFDGSQLFSVIFVTTESIKVELLAQALILMFDWLENVVDLLAVQYLLIIHTSNGVENSPHDLRIVNSTKMISDIEAENDFVQFSFLDSNSLVSKWWW